MQTIKINKFGAKIYFQGVKRSLDNLSVGIIEKITAVLYRAYKSEKKIILMGNGGSAATASHFVCDLTKGAVVPGKKRFRAFALSDNIPLISAYANDCGYPEVFLEQLKNIVDRGDVVIGISASGNSLNVLKALSYAKTKSALTIGVTGFDGGKLKDLVDQCLVVSNDNMEQIEDVHLVILHAIKLILKHKIEKERKRR